jgi:ATP-dependent helicase/nuclease subunit B
VHKALERFFAAHADALPRNALDDLLRLGREAFAAEGATPALLALWWPRFERAARWFLQYETARRESGARSLVEQKGSLVLPGPGGGFTLIGRADRIDVFADGTASVIDYKTGAAPSNKQIAALLAPQLPLEAAMLLERGFSGLHASAMRELLHVRLSGGEPPGEERAFDGDATEIARQALEALVQRIAEFDDPERPYRAHEAWERLSYAGDYDHLARLREWSSGVEDE